MTLKETTNYFGNWYVGNEGKNKEYFKSLYEAIVTHITMFVLGWYKRIVLIVIIKLISQAFGILPFLMLHCIFTTTIVSLCI